MTHQRVRVALIGTGGIARAHREAIRLNEDRVELVAAVDIDEARVNAFCSENDIPHAYSDPVAMLHTERPQLVHICTPPGTHCELSIQAMESGAWVLCEKPLCASLAEMDRIEEVEQRTGNYCASVFQWRFGAGGQHLKKLIDSEAMGPPVVGTALTTWYRDEDYYAVPWRGNWASELGGCSMIHGIHAMDFLLWLFGEWREVRAMMDTLVHNIDVEDVSMASVRFANGALANITNSVLSPRPETYMRFDFPKATVELTHLYGYNNEHWRYSMVEGADYEDKLTEWATLPADRIARHPSQLSDLLDDMERNQRPLTSGPGVRGTIEFLTALYKSAITGQPVLRGSIQPGDIYYTRMNGDGDQSWQRPR